MMWFSRPWHRGRDHGIRPRTSLRLRPSAEGLEDRALMALTRFPITGVFDGDAVLGPVDAGPDGNLWFVDRDLSSSLGNVITLDRLTPDGQFSTVATLAGQITISGLTNGPDGNVWYAGQRPLGLNSGATEAVIGRVSPSGSLAEFVVPDASSAPNITAAHDGNLWFTAISSGGLVLVGRITPGGQITEYPLGTQSNGASPVGIAADARGNLWIALNSQSSGVHEGSSALVRITSSGQISEWIPLQVRVPASRGMKAQVVAPVVSSMTADSNGNIWVAEQVFGSNVRQAIVRVSPSGRFRRFTVFPSGVNKYPNAITAAPGPTLFFSILKVYPSVSGNLSKLGEISKSGRVSFIGFPRYVFPFYVQPGAFPVTETGGIIWFVDGNIGIDRLTLPGPHRRNGA